MAPESHYLRVDEGTLLDQGEIIPNCPLPGWDSEFLNAELDDDLESCLNTFRQVYESDAVVVTQTCDLLNPGKAKFVTLCPMDRESDFRESAIQSRPSYSKEDAWNKYLNNIHNGKINIHAYLPPGKVAEIDVPSRIVYLDQAISLPIRVLQHFVEKRDEPRIRLDSPWRESVSQRFGGNFSRVGLPDLGSILKNTE